MEAISHLYPINADEVKASLHQSLARQRAAFQERPYPTVKQRRAQLRALENLLRSNFDAFAEAIDEDFGGRSTHETFLIDWLPCMDEVRIAYRSVGKWMRPRRVPVSMSFWPASARIMPQPLGVVGIVVPWNYPLFLAMAPLAAALAAGNRVMIKMSEFTPRVGKLMQRLIGEFFSEDQVCVINGGTEVAQAFTSLPFDHLLFTGSTTVGRHVMRAAAENLTPVTLELGGKSPVIIGSDHDIQVAAERILFGKCLNAGQSCTAPDYVLVPIGKEESLIAALKREAARLYPTLATNPDYTSIIDQRQHARLQSYLHDAKAKGGHIVELNESGEDLSGTGKIAPTLVLKTRDDMQVMQEEIFGPLLPIVPYETLDQAINYVNERPRPLALYYFGHRAAEVERVLQGTLAGGVTINDTMFHVAQHHLPFGGVGASGMGHYHGKFGFDTFSKQKGVLYQSRFSGIRLVQPPYGRIFTMMRQVLTHILLGR